MFGVASVKIGMTSAMVAIEHEREDCLGMLIAAGSDLDLQNSVSQNTCINDELYGQENAGWMGVWACVEG